MAAKNPISSFSARAAEIFLTSAAAFQKLGELTMQLNFTAEAQHHSHWTDKDLDLLQDSILRFSDDLSRISESVREKTNTQVKLDLKRKTVDDATYVGVNTLMGPGSAPNVKRKSQTPSVPLTKRAGSSVVTLKMPPQKQQYSFSADPDYSDGSGDDY